MLNFEHIPSKIFVYFFFCWDSIFLSDSIAFISTFKQYRIYKISNYNWLARKIKFVCSWFASIWQASKNGKVYGIVFHRGLRTISQSIVN